MGNPWHSWYPWLPLALVVPMGYPWYPRLCCPAGKTKASHVLLHGAMPGLELAEELVGHAAYGGREWDGRGYRFDYLVAICRLRVQAAGYVDEKGIPRTLDYYRESGTTQRLSQHTGRPERRRL
eukprot:14804477-Alexandrium_andersonii.AAC.1